jgi:short-subunit dehydrogenase
MAGLREYRDRVAVVTGASAGIGAALARALAQRGAKLALVARRGERLEALAEEIRSAGGTASAYPCDVSDRTAVEATCRTIEVRWGPVDLLVNGAGFARHVLFQDHDVSDMERMVATNVLGPIYWIRSALPGMRKRGGGWIVNLSSFAGVVAQPDEAVYSATKYALTGLSDALHFELEGQGISVACVYPVLVRTEMFTPDVIDRMPERALRQFMEPEEFVRRVLRALERGEREIYVPRHFTWIRRLRALFPGWMGPIFAKVKLDAIKER